MVVSEQYVSSSTYALQNNIFVRDFCINLTSIR